MKALYDSIKTQPVLYVTRDIERALGMDPKDGYYILTNTSSYSKKIKEQFSENVFLIEENRTLDTYELLLHRDTERIIQELGASIVVFKNTSRIERLCQEKKWNLLNPRAELANTIEGKISQVGWLGDFVHYLPPHEVVLCKNISAVHTPFIIQFDHGHTGESTFFIRNQAELTALQEKFPDRPVRKTTFIDGPIFTSNNVVTSTSVVMGNISYQITGLPPFTHLPFSTIGNDWGLPHTILSDDQKKQFATIVDSIGKKMLSEGWIGLFGVDIIFDITSGKLYLLEINARQPASSTFESKLQRTHQDTGITIFEGHLASLLGIHFEKSGAITIMEGAQVVQRIHTNWHKQDSERIQDELVKTGLTVLLYDNEKSNADAVRIQTHANLMSAHNILNALGKKISHTLS